MHKKEFEDLSLFNQRLESGLAIPDIKHIGQLGTSKGVPSGPLLPSFVDSLRSLILGRDRFDVRCGVVRGGWNCAFCDYHEGHIFLPDRVADETDEMFRFCNIWIPATSGVVYAADSLLYHYVTKHDYAPPLEFQEALMFYVDNHEKFDWDADVFQEKVVHHGFLRKWWWKLFPLKVKFRAK